MTDSAKCPSLLLLLFVFVVVDDIVVVVAFLVVDVVVCFRCCFRLRVQQPSHKSIVVAKYKLNLCGAVN